MIDFTPLFTPHNGTLLTPKRVFDDVKINLYENKYIITSSLDKICSTYNLQPCEVFRFKESDALQEGGEAEDAMESTAFNRNSSENSPIPANYVRGRVSYKKLFEKLSQIKTPYSFKRKAKLDGGFINKLKEGEFCTYKKLKIIASALEVEPDSLWESTSPSETAQKIALKTFKPKDRIETTVVKQILKKRKITCTALSKMTGISMATLYAAFKNGYVSFKLFEKIAAALKMPMEALIKVSPEEATSCAYAKASRALSDSLSIENPATQDDALYIKNGVSLKKLFQAIYDSNISPKALAKISGVNEQIIKLLFKRKYCPFAILVKLAKALGRDANDLWEKV